MSFWKARIPMKIKKKKFFGLSSQIASLQQNNMLDGTGLEMHIAKCVGKEKLHNTSFLSVFLANYCWWTYREALSWTLTPISLQQFLTFSRGKGEIPNSKMIFFC
jgi:hypothetical protein